MTLKFGKFDVFYQNVDGLGDETKQQYLKKFSKEKKHNVYVLVETKLNKNIKKSKLFDTTQYSVFRNDRKSDHNAKGGILIALEKPLNKKDFKYDRKKIKNLCLSDKTGYVDYLWIQVLKQGFVTLNVIALYMHPDCKLYNYATLMERLWSQLKTTINERMLIVGDFNCKEYMERIGDKQTPREGTFRLAIHQMAEKLNLKQYSLIKNKTGNILDMVFCNEKLDVSRRPSDLESKKQDHFAFTFEIVSFVSQNIPRAIPIAAEAAEVTSHLCPPTSVPTQETAMRKIFWSYLEDLKESTKIESGTPEELLEKAQSLQLAAEIEVDELKQHAYYLEAVTIRMLCSEQANEKSLSISSLIKALELIEEDSLKNESLQNVSSQKQSHIKLRVLDLRCLSYIYGQLNKLNNDDIEENMTKILRFTGLPMSQEIFDLFQKQSFHFICLRKLLNFWDEADKLALVDENITKFFVGIDHDVGPLIINSSLRHLVEYIQLAIEKTLGVDVKTGG